MTVSGIAFVPSGPHNSYDRAAVRRLLRGRGGGNGRRRTSASRRRTRTRSRPWNARWCWRAGWRTRAGRTRRSSPALPDRPPQAGRRHPDVHLSTPAQAAAGDRREPDARRWPAGQAAHRGRDQDPVRARQPRGQRRSDPDLRPAHQVPRRHHGAGRATARPTSTASVRLAGGEAAIPAFRADLARVTGRSTSTCCDENIWIGDPVRTVTRIRGGLPARVRARGAARRAGPRRPVGGQVRLGRGGGTAGAAGGGADPAAGGVVRRARPRAWPRSPAPRSAWPPRSSPPTGCRSALASLAEPEPGDQRRTGWCSASGWGAAVLLVLAGDGGHRVDRFAGRVGCPRPQVRRGRGRGPGGSAGARHRRRAVRARAGARARGGARSARRSRGRSPGCSACWPR